jgi:hypothetical protein
MEKVIVMYVGPKPFAVDNVTGSGATWEGRGSTASVTPEQAKRLFGYPDQWWPEGKLPTLEEVTERLKEFFASNGGGIPDGVVLPKTLDEMNLTELRDYARSEYGANLPVSLNEKQARSEIEELELADQKNRGHVGNLRHTRRPSSKPAAKATTKKAEPAAKKKRLPPLKHLGVELDQRKSIKDLRAQVSALIAAHKAK